MNPQHFSDEEAQQAAEAQPLPADRAIHLRACSRCQAQVATYRQLFGAAAHLPQPAFDFDLAARVVAQLPQPQPAVRWVLGGLVCAVVAVVAVFLAWFGRELQLAFAGLPAGLGAWIALAAGGLVAAGGWGQLTHYRHQLRQLAFS